LVAGTRVKVVRVPAMRGEGGESERRRVKVVKMVMERVKG
jgi:hypothetical protein